MRQTITCLIAIFILTACSGNDLWLGTEKKEKLEGERIAVETFQQDTAPKANVAIQLPSIQKVTEVTASSGHNNIKAANIEIPDNLIEKRSWNLGVNRKFAIANSPIITSTLFIIQDANGIITAYNMNDNKIAWVNKHFAKSQNPGLFNLSSTLSVGGMLAYEGVLYVTSGTNEAIALDLASGEKKWSATLSSAVRSVPQIGGKNVIIQSVDDQVYGINLENGEVVWSHFANNEEITILHSTSPIVLGNVMVTQNSIGEILGIDVKSGEMLWDLDLTSTIERLAIRAEMHDVIHSPAIYGNSILAYGNDGILSKINAEKGTQEWNSNLGINRPFWIAGNAIFALDNSGKILAIEVSSGKVIWSHQLELKEQKTKELIFWTAPIVAGGNVITVSSGGTLMKINALDGVTISSHPVIKGVYTRPIIVEGKLYLVSHSGKIVEYGSN